DITLAGAGDGNAVVGEDPSANDGRVSDAARLLVHDAAGGCCDGEAAEGVENDSAHGLRVVGGYFCLALTLTLLLARVRAKVHVGHRLKAVLGTELVRGVSS